MRYHHAGVQGLEVQNYYRVRVETTLREGEKRGEVGMEGGENEMWV